MSLLAETGHSKNVANFEKLIIYCSGMGESYNPSRKGLLIESMQSQLSASRESVLLINDLLPAYKTAVAERIQAFKELESLVTKINNALKASGASNEMQASVQTIIRKLRGKRATPKKTDEQKKEAMESGKEIVEISSSQMSYDNRLNNLDKLIKQLSNITEYSPNEKDLQIKSLEGVYNQLSAKNKAVITAYMPLSNARIERNKLLYSENEGMIDIANGVKSYIKSIFGAASPQYKQLSNLKFTNASN
jgi:hypothetical protein